MSEDEVYKKFIQKEIPDSVKEFDTLYIGCSHATGTYDKDDNIINRIESIPYRTSKILDQKWKSIALSGHGIFAYATIIEYLIQSKQLYFKNIIIQQTFEPRLNHVEEEKLHKVIYEYMLNDKDTTLHAYIQPYWWCFITSQQKLYDEQFKTSQSKLDYLRHLQHFDAKFNKTRDIGPGPDNLWIDMSYRYIESICKLKGINLYSFAWATSFRDTEYIKNTRNIRFGDEPSVMDWLGDKKDEVLTNSGKHPTKDAVQMISKELALQLKTKLTTEYY
jgi:hypothetical protein